jgi:glycosyltransferase involved in cell wall biosynthesis
MPWKRQMEIVSRAQVYVVIPAYNEGTVLSRVVTEVKRAGYAVVVVDDGSTDATADHAHAAGATSSGTHSTSVRAPRCRPASTTRWRNRRNSW